MEIRELASGLKFPEGPVAMADGSVMLVEINRGTLSRVTTEGEVEVIAELGGGPNGAAIGPDGAVYVCNDGGFIWTELGEHAHPDRPRAPAPASRPNFEGGWIERVDLDDRRRHPAVRRSATATASAAPTTSSSTRPAASGSPTSARCGRATLTAAGCTTPSPTARASSRPPTALWGRTASGSRPTGRRCTSPRASPASCWRGTSTGPGQLAKAGAGHGGRVLAATKGHFDSLAVEAERQHRRGRDLGGSVRRLPRRRLQLRRDARTSMTTNVCFGGPDLPHRVRHAVGLGQARRGRLAGRGRRAGVQRVSEATPG